MVFTSSISGTRERAETCRSRAPDRVGSGGSSTENDSMRDAPPNSRPWTVTALSVFFALGATISGLSFIALMFPGGLLEPMWRLNPRAREQLTEMGGWAMLLMAVVSVLCALTARGLWRGSRIGFVLGVTMLVVSLLGDL